jgi:hypothetical protein
MIRIVALLIGAGLLGACGGDPASPARPDVAGTYALTELRFDPQGALPEVDLRARLDVRDVVLVLAPGGAAELRWIDPATGLSGIVRGVYSTPTGGVRIHFDTRPVLLVLSMRMTLDEDPVAGTLWFDGSAPDGVDRGRLAELVPEWSDEPLVDPVPGRLVVEFTRFGAGSLAD